MLSHFRSSPVTLRRPVLALSIAAAFGLLASNVAQAQVSVNIGITASEPGWFYDRGDVVSVYVDAPEYQPEPVAIAWAPPPMLVEEVPPQPDPYAVWTGGYWTWQGDWVWCAGRWMDPPRREYTWVEPYYEHREDRVIFIPGFWSTPEAVFIVPSIDRPIAWAYVNEGVVIGPRPEGPVGIFVPPPPGSRPGLIIPAPIGTPPAVVISAPPVMAVGMRITGTVALDAHRSINDNRVASVPVASLRRVANVTVQAPAAATANGREFQAQVPHQAHLAAALHPQVVARAPQPVSRTAVPAYVPGRTVAALPPPQKVQGLPPVPSHGAATVPQAQRAQMAHAPLTPDEARQAHAGGHDIEHLPPTAAGQQGAHPAPGANEQQAAQRAQQERAQQEAQQHSQQQQAQQRVQQEEAQRIERSQQQAKQHAQEEVQQRAQLQQAQRAEQQHAQQEAQQRSQQQAQQRAEQQHAQQEQAQRTEQQRAQQEAQQRAQQESQQRSQQQAQQHAQQEQAQRAEQQRAQQEAQQRSQQQAQQRAQQEAQQRSQQQAQQNAQQEAQQQRSQQQAQQHAQQEQAQRAEQQHPPQERGERARPRGEEASRPSN